MDFPHEWEIFPGEQFTTAGPRSAGECGVEVLAQIRPNGRILDHFRVTLGGSRMVDVTVPMSKMLLCPASLGWQLRFAIWPRDICLRRNMATAAWNDVTTIIQARDALVKDVEGTTVDTKVVLAELAKTKCAASVRFGAFIAADFSLELGLQCLPAAADTLMGKPALRG
jgi:hypothetical protein